MSETLRDDQISDAFVAVMNYIGATGDYPIKGRVFERQVDEHWYIAVNATDAPAEAGPADGMRSTVNPIDCAVWWNGWLAGSFNPHGGILAAGTEANEDRFIADLKAATAKLPAVE